MENYPIGDKNYKVQSVVLIQSYSISVRVSIPPSFHKPAKNKSL